MHRVALLLLVAAGCAREPVREVHVLHLTPDLSIGGAEEGPSSFADIRWFVVDARHRLYVLDAQSQDVRVFDSSGTYLLTLGHKGAGPGEFTMANGLALGP